MRPIWARRRDPAAFHLGTPEIGTARDSGFAADSSLEGNGFELSVPHETGSGFEASSEFGADRLSARRYHPGSRRPRQNQ